MKTVGLVTALRAEAATLGPTPRNRQRIYDLDRSHRVALSGVGAQRAGRAARSLLDEGAGALVSFGLAGGLDPALGAGTVVLPESVQDASGRCFAVDAAWRAAVLEHLPASTPSTGGAIVQTDQLLVDPADKKREHRRSGAVAVDMESAAVARLAATSGVPLLVARVICDAAGQALPPVAVHAVDPTGGVRPWRAMLEFVRRPAQLSDLLRLRRTYKTALAALATTGAALALATAARFDTPPSVP